MKHHRLPKKLLYGELSQGNRSQGRQKKRFKDTLKVPMKSFGIGPNCLEYLVPDRDKWREIVRCEAKVCEARRYAATNLKEVLPHQLLPPPFLVHTTQDSSAHKLVSLAICALMDSILNHKVDLMVRIDYNGQRRRRVWLSSTYGSLS